MSECFGQDEQDCGIGAWALFLDSGPSCESCQIGLAATLIGLARYDSDRGGAQEDDRTGQYREVAQEIIGYADSHGMPNVKVVYVNDGSGLLLGSMWNDYAYLEDQWPERVRVVTLRMVPERITAKWLRS